MIPSIIKLRNRLLQWALDSWVQIAPASRAKTQEVIDMRIREWFFKWLALRRKVAVTAIKDSDYLTPQEAIYAIGAFKTHFQKEMSDDPFKGHWGAISVHKFLVHADHSYHYRRPSSSKRSQA